MRAGRWVWILGMMFLSGCLAFSSAATPDDAAVVPSQTTATQEALPEPTDSLTRAPELLPEEPAPPGGEREFSTDFSRHTVPYDEILSGGPPKDGIPAIDAPRVHSVSSADVDIEDVEPVILVEVDGNVRAYPIQILTWHEIVNDTIGDVPIAVTFCPLCNTAIAFDRRFQDGDETLVLDFGTTGRLRYSNLIMYDRQTETWWQQATGEGIAGEFAGQQLDLVPANIISWADYKAAYPNGEVLSRETGFSRAYGNNPYAGYDDINNSPFLYQGPETPGELPPMARVLTVEIDGEAVAFPYTTLAEQGVVNDEVDGEPIVVLWQPGVASALDQSSIAESRDVGTVVAFSRRLGGDVLVFAAEDGMIIDEATGSEWNVFGAAVAGPLEGEQLAPTISIPHFWFSWAAFRPETRVYVPVEGNRNDDDPTPQPSTPETSTEGVFVQLDEDFEIVVYTGGAALGGDRVMFSDLFAQGKPVVVEFWAGACPVCRRALPEMEAAYRGYREDVLFVGIDIGSFTGLGDERAARALYADLGLSFPTGTILDSSPLQTYRVTGIPTTLYFTPAGEVFDHGGGIVGVETLSESLDALIAASQ